jgi:hypothetical protein
LITVDNLMYGTTYGYRVKAGNKIGFSLWGPEFLCHTNTPHSGGFLLFAFLKVRLISQKLEPATPDPPILLASGNSWLQVQWVAPADNGSSIVEYELSQYSRSELDWTIVHVGPGFSFNASALLGSTQYFFKVKARNSHGWGSYSLASKFTTLNPGLPSAPSDVWMISSNSSSITLAWDQAIDNGARISLYQLQRNGMEVFSGKALIFTDGQLAPESMYYYTVRARNTIGYSAWSVNASFLTAGLCFHILLFTSSPIL